VRKIIRNLLDFSRQTVIPDAAGRSPATAAGNGLAPAGRRHRLRGADHRGVSEFPVIVSMDHDEIKQVFINSHEQCAPRHAHGR